MVRGRPAEPPRWSYDELEADRRIALAAFIAERGQEGTAAYKAAFQSNEAIVRQLFELTHDLLEFTGPLFEAQPGLIAAARFLGGPPVSADDLVTLVGARLGSRIDPDLAQRVADVLRAAWDPIRCPWLPEGRFPTRHERGAAINWTAGIWAVERLRTLRRTTSSRQETAVVAALRAEGYDVRPRPQVSAALDALPR